MKKCRTGSRDYRKVTSHVFGRNKKCTSQIPEACWIVYCRKHYQRTRYRTTKGQTHSYFHVQIDIIRRQLDRFEEWGGVRSWTITLRKKERDSIIAEDEDLAALSASSGPVSEAAQARILKCRDRFLLGRTGSGKTFSQVRRCINHIEQEVERTGRWDLPGFELLPDIDEKLHPPSKTRISSDGNPKTEFDTDDDMDLEEGEIRELTTSRVLPSRRPTRSRQLEAKARRTSTSRSSTPYRITKREAKYEKDKKTRRLVQASQRHLTLRDDSEVADVESHAESSAIASFRAKVQDTQPNTAPRKKGLAYALHHAAPSTSTGARSLPRLSPRDPFPVPIKREVRSPSLAPMQGHTALGKTEFAGRDTPLPAGSIRSMPHFRIPKKIRPANGNIGFRERKDRI